MRIYHLAALFLALLFLGACAPDTADPGRVEVQQLADGVTFYPRQTGMVWRYLKDGERLDELPLLQQVQGPAMLGGEVLIATRLWGRGLDTTYYRRYSIEGVHLLRETRPGVTIDFDPPRQEFPPAELLSVGASWGGRTTARMYFPEALPENRYAEVPVDYRYSVVDRREVTTTAGSFEVFVINLSARELSEEAPAALEQVMWFAPYVGEVRNTSGYVLVGKNFRSAREAGQP